MALPPIYRAPLDGTEMMRVFVDGRWYMAPIAAIAAIINAPLLTRVSALEKADAAQALRDAGQDAALAQEAAARSAADAAEVAARATADTAAAGRLTTLEAKSEEVAHFTATGRFPTLAVAGSFTLTLTVTAPARSGDVLRAGEQVEVWAIGGDPKGVTLGRPTVPADGTITLPCAASLALAASTGPTTFAVVALR